MALSTETREALVCGLMSGTSVDGIDAAIFRLRYRHLAGGDSLPAGIHTESTDLVCGRTFPFPDHVRQEILDLSDDPPGALDRMVVLNMVLGEHFARAVLDICALAGMAPRELAVVGSHGQTIRHLAQDTTTAGRGAEVIHGRGSLQIGEGSVIAQRCGVPTVWNFRPADLAAGGTGAPLVPFLDSILAGQHGNGTVFLNIGGIANLSAFMGTCTAFDTGPGNMIADRLAAHLSKGVLRYDKDGQIGSRGSIDADLLDQWLADPWYRQPPPKSAGRERFGSEFWNSKVMPLLGRDDPGLMRTIEALTATSIARAMKDFLPREAAKLIVCGGGAHNPIIMADLARLLPRTRVLNGDQAGISTDFKEALAFALMGFYTLHGLPCTIPEATGARAAVAAGTLSLPAGQSGKETP